MTALDHAAASSPIAVDRPGETEAAIAARPAARDCDDLDDAALVMRFEALAIAPADFRHREHVRVAYAMLRSADFGEAAVRYRAALRRFAAAAGVPDRYHETLTWAYLAVIARRMAEDPSAATSVDFVARHPDLLDHKSGAVARYYDIAAITASPLARAVFVLPEH